VSLAERLAIDLANLCIPQIAISVNHRDIDVGM
jgi:hypothetical protein